MYNNSVFFSLSAIVLLIASSYIFYYTIIAFNLFQCANNPQQRLSVCVYSTYTICIIVSFSRNKIPHCSPRQFPFVSLACSVHYFRTQHLQSHTSALLRLPLSFRASISCLCSDSCIFIYMSMRVSFILFYYCIFAPPWWNINKQCTQKKPSKNNPCYKNFWLKIIIKKKGIWNVK